MAGGSNNRSRNLLPYQGLPELAGLCSMDRAIDASWSLDESVQRLKRLHYVLKRMHEILTSRITAEPIYELKTAMSYHAYLFAEQVTLVRKRVAEMREPPLELDKIPHPALELLMDELQSAPDTAHFLMGAYQDVLPAIIGCCIRLKHDAHPLADAPTVRVAKLIEFELQDLLEFGNHAVYCLVNEPEVEHAQPWLGHLRKCLAASGHIDGTEPESDEVPPRFFSKPVAQYDPEPKRDHRFQDRYNAGVNPESFLYDERFSARDKTLMMYYKRIRELDVPEMMASILVELRDDEPWEFHMEMSRQLWDEARHAMMGQVGFVSHDIDWTQIPINFTWSKNLNEQLNARERHGVLFFIEQNLMPKNGKRYEWEVATQSGDPLSKLFQDFDWADEVLHAQIGRRWYVPQFGNLSEALAYGDKCWSQVLSHWQSYRDKGLTDHRNWWPDLYRQACLKWGVQPDPEALAFHDTYEEKRADLESI
ncbi:hypothetical protein [Stieleria varia]|uniref:DUF455 family protein n=1 Tax=Stieleria varia TaxID=2528005 RepID=A0A5C6A422_9BACT|nr:hypothetical protein [Stieleria varia]TWT94654.1 hypothetical protein Pla52n_54750 [Stieleria varia]